MKRIICTSCAIVLGTVTIDFAKTMTSFPTQIPTTCSDDGNRTYASPVVEQDGSDTGSETEYDPLSPPVPSLKKTTYERMPNPQKRGIPEIPVSEREEWFSSLQYQVQRRLLSYCYIGGTRTPLKMCTEVREAFNNYIIKHPHALDWLKDRPKAFEIKRSIIVIHPKVLIPLCEIKSAVARSQLADAICEFDKLNATARGDFEIRIAGLDVQTAQQIAKIIKADYETSSTPVVDSIEKTPSAPSQNRKRCRRKPAQTPGTDGSARPKKRRRQLREPAKAPEESETEPE